MRDLFKPSTRRAIAKHPTSVREACRVHFPHEAVPPYHHLHPPSRRPVIHSSAPDFPRPHHLPIYAVIAPITLNLGIITAIISGESTILGTLALVLLAASGSTGVITLIKAHHARFRRGGHPHRLLANIILTIFYVGSLFAISVVVPNSTTPLAQRIAGNAAIVLIIGVVLGIITLFILFVRSPNPAPSVDCDEPRTCVYCSAELGPGHAYMCHYHQEEEERQRAQQRARAQNPSDNQY